MKPCTDIYPVFALHHPRQVQIAGKHPKHLNRTDLLSLMQVRMQLRAPRHQMGDCAFKPPIKPLQAKIVFS